MLGDLLHNFTSDESINSFAAPKVLPTRTHGKLLRGRRPHPIRRREIIRYIDESTDYRPRLIFGDVFRLANTTRDNDRNYMQADTTASLILQDRKLTPWADLYETVDGWSRLEAGWDADEAVPPSRSAIHATREFLRRAEACGLAPPRPYLTSDGEIGFHWRGQNGIATWSLLPEDEFLAFVSHSARQPLRLNGRHEDAQSASFLAAAKAIR